MPTVPYRATFLSSLLLALVVLVVPFPAASDPIPSLYLHESYRPLPHLFVDASVPSAVIPKFADSPGLTLGGGNNRWKEIGTWKAARGAFVGTVDDPLNLHVYLGLKNPVDQAARFGLRVELYKNRQLVSSGQVACIAGLTFDPRNAKEVVVALDAFPQVPIGAADALTVQVFARIGTSETGAHCGGPGHATGLRMYFDAAKRASQLSAPEVLLGGVDWNTGIGATSDRRGLSRAVGPDSPLVLWQGTRPALFGQQVVIEGTTVVSTQTEAFGATGAWIVAQDLHNGTELWRRQLPNEASGGASRVTAFRDGQVYVTRAGNGVQDYLYALNPIDGSEIWHSQDPVDEFIADSPAFAANGDIIVGNSYSVVRINRLNGTTVWSTAPAGFTMPTVLGDRVYAWDYVAGYVVSVFDVASGNKLFSSEVIELDAFPAASPIVSGRGGTLFVGNGGTSGAHFIGLQDLGGALVVKWRIPMADLAFASFGVGPDGSVYTYSPSNQVLRVDPATGSVINASMPIPGFGTRLYAPRMGIDSAGKVFVTADAETGAMLYSFNADLTLRWSESIPNVNLGGPALAGDGTLVVSGDAIRAYKTP